MVRKIKRYKTKAAIVTLAVLLFLPTICFIDSLRYPRIARSAYWRQPDLLAKATVTCLFPGKGISKQAILAHARQLRSKGDLNIRLLYLPALPKNDSTIRARVFGAIVKRSVHTKENLFWIVSPRDGPNDDTLAYEYTTGHLVVCQDMSKLGELANK